VTGAAPSDHRCTVLVVEDDVELRELVRVALTADGYEVASVDNGREAMHYLRSHADVCIVVLDLALPIMDGAQFRSAQLRDRALAWIPLVVMSGSADAARHARELGARRLVRKPLDVDELRNALRFVGCCQSRSRQPRPRPHVS
jgi:CheY-like chemotaxis protein